MSLDAFKTKLRKHGTVTIFPEKEGLVQITVEGFEADNASCRDVAVLACLWAIGELQREVMLAVQEPGTNAIGIA
jgi:hypothetical protein